jgi:hypothetical protein
MLDVDDIALCPEWPSRWGRLVMLVLKANLPHRVQRMLAGMDHMDCPSILIVHNAKRPFC